MSVFGFNMFKELITIALQLIITPAKGWMSVNEKEETEDLFHARFLHPLFGLIGASALIGGLWLSPEGNLQIAVKEMIIAVVSVFGGYFIAAYLLNESAPRFGLVKSLFVQKRFTGYASVAIYLLFAIMPLLRGVPILWLFAFYTFYIVYEGARVYYEIEDNRRTTFSAVASAIILLPPVLIEAILSLII